MCLRKHYKIVFAVLGLFLLNFLTGLCFINEGLFHHDSVQLAKAVEATYRTGVLQPAVNGRYGAVVINAILYAPFFLLGQNADFATRFSSVLFHALSIIVLFWFVYELFENYICAFFAALMFSFVPFYFIPNTYGKEHGMSVFFMLLSFCLLNRGVRRNSLRLIGWASFMYAFSAFVRESILVTLPVYLFLYFWPEASWAPFKIAVLREKFSPKALFWLVVPLALIVGILFLTSFGPVFYKTFFVNDSFSNNFIGFFSKHFRLALWDLIISVPGILFSIAVLGMYRLSFKQTSFFIFLLLWAFLIFIYGNTSCYASRFLEVAMMPVFIFAAYALSWIWEKYKTVAMLIAVSIAMAMFIFMYPMLEVRHRYNGEKQFALYVRDVTEENAVVISQDSGPFIEYYGHRKVMLPPLGAQRTIGEFIARIRMNFDNNVPVYLTGEALYYDNADLIRPVIINNFHYSLIGGRFFEDYHHPELRFRMRYQKLYKLSYKVN